MTKDQNKNQNEEVINLIERLEKFPHIQNKLRLHWGYKAGRELLTSLTYSDRPNRQGFPFDAVLAIDALVDLHDAYYPKFKPLLDPVWDNNFRNTTRKI
jgi:hypothetical protein